MNRLIKFYIQNIRKRKIIVREIKSLENNFLKLRKNMCIFLKCLC